MDNIIIQGSSRSEGNSNIIAKTLQEYLTADLIDLKQKEINSYSYAHEFADDDFLPVMRQVVAYDTVIFITPVYWYAMSGIMKNFFDRITDCLKTEKELGRKLRGMNMAAISCGSDNTKTEGFFVPFSSSAGYLGMNYLGDLHTWVEGGLPSREVKAEIERFVAELEEKLSK